MGVEEPAIRESGISRAMLPVVLTDVLLNLLEEFVVSDSL